MLSEEKFRCPVCGFPELSEPPYDKDGCSSFDICPSCGTEFGYTDATKPHSVLRRAWLNAGAHWSSKVTAPPENWDAFEQLRAAGLDAS